MLKAAKGDLVNRPPCHLPPATAMPARLAGSSTPEATQASQARRRLGQAGWVAVITVLTLLGFGATSVVAQAAENPVSLVSHGGLCNASVGHRNGATAADVGVQHLEGSP